MHSEQHPRAQLAGATAYVEIFADLTLGWLNPRAARLQRNLAEARAARRPPGE